MWFYPSQAAGSCCFLERAGLNAAFRPEVTQEFEYMFHVSLHLCLSVSHTADWKFSGYFDLFSLLFALYSRCFA